MLARRPGRAAINPPRITSDTTLQGSIRLWERLSGAMNRFKPMPIFVAVSIKYNQAEATFLKPNPPGPTAGSFFAENRIEKAGHPR